MFTKIYDEIKSFIKENYRFLVVLLLTFLLFRVELPYKIYTPGGMVDLSTRIEVENGYSSDGTLGMAYVSMVNGSIPFLLMSYLLPNWDIVPTSELTYENETLEEVLEADKIAMQQAMDHAIISAYQYAKKEIQILKEEAHVTYIDQEAQTDLELFDIIQSVDNKEIHTLDELRKVIQNKKENDEVELQVIRDGKEKVVHATVYSTEDGLKIGISLTTTYDYQETPKVTIKAKESESGPSGGLMMSLAIYNQLVEEDITKGRKIIGTGTIDQLGNVGEIGGVEYKLLGAAKKKGDIFLVPMENYEEALQVKTDHNLSIQVIGVRSLKEAIEALKAI